MYKTLNTRVTIIGVIVWDQKDEIAVNESASMTLTEFSNYTTKTIHGEMNLYNDNAQLIT